MRVVAYVRVPTARQPPQNTAGRNPAVAGYEHSETWGWRSGETALLHFVSVHHVEGDRITLWKNYWEMGALMSQAPPTLTDEFGSADTSWVFDATGLI